MAGGHKKLNRNMRLAELNIKYDETNMIFLIITTKNMIKINSCENEVVTQVLKFLITLFTNNYKI